MPKEIRTESSVETFCRDTVEPLARKVIWDDASEPDAFLQIAQKYNEQGLHGQWNAGFLRGFWRASLCRFAAEKEAKARLRARA